MRVAASSTVIAVSAMLVVSTTLRTPWGGLSRLVGLGVEGWGWDYGQGCA